MARHRVGRLLPFENLEMAWSPQHRLGPAARRRKTALGLWTALVASACASGDTSVGSGPQSGVGSAAQESSTTRGDSSAGEVSATDGPATSSSAETSADFDTSSGETGPCEETTWYFDGDGDGRGDASMTILACVAPPDYVAFGDDCNDADPRLGAGSDEVCDGVDNDCDTAIDEASATNSECNGCTLFAVASRSYGFCPAGAQWQAARTQCAVFGGDLLRIDDAAENAAVAGLPEPQSPIGGGWFIGLTDAGARGAFVWVDGGGLSFASWLAGEPNDAGGNEDCAEMEQAGGGWNDIPCDLERAFICEAAAP